jgi:hypothetical protein
MVYASELLLERLLSSLCADVNNTSHASCDIMCLIYANMFTLLLLLSPGECHWSWRWVSSFHEVSSVLKCWLLVGAIGSSRTERHLFYCLAAEQILQTNNVEVIWYYPSQTYWMYLFWAFVEALALIGYLHSDGGASWRRKRYEPIGWRDALFLARLYYYSPFYRRPLWNGLNLLVIYMGKYRGQWLWAKWQSTIAGTDLPAWNGAKSPNWSTTIPMLASHEVETPPTPPKPIHMVSGVMLVKGYSMRQQSAIVVSEFLPSFKTTRKSKSTQEEGPTMSLLCIVQETSVKYSEPSCNVYG